MKNYAAIFLGLILCLTTFTDAVRAQEEVIDSYFDGQVKISKQETSESKTVSSENGVAPANDNFAAAVPITVGATGNLILTSSNTGASKEAGEPNHADNLGGSSVWYDFTPAITRAYEIRTISGETNFDTTLAVYKGNTLASLVLLGSNDDCFRVECGTRSRVRLFLEAGTTYRIAIDGYHNGTSAASGTFKMIIESQIGAPENDNLANAYDLGVANAGGIGMTNYLATLEANEPSHANGGSPGGKSVWFKIRTMSSRAMTFRMTNDFAGEMAVYRSFEENPTFGDLEKLDSSADHIGFNGGRTEVKFFAWVSQYYFIAVDYNANNNESQTGNFHLKFFQTKLPYSMNIDNYTNQASLGIFRPSEGVWYNHEDINYLGSPKYVKFGLPGDTPVPADFDGDGIANHAVVRNLNGLKHWYFLHETYSTSYTYKQWGLATDKAVVGDFDRDGRADMTVIRNVGGQMVWYVNQSRTGEMRAFVFGLAGDKPVLGDFDGDGATEVAVVRSEGGNLSWHILLSNGNLFYTQLSGATFGLTTDITAAQDYDGDGKTDIAVWRPSTGTWYIVRSATGELQITEFGLSGDKPQPADYDNDGKADLALFRPAQGKWYFWLSATNTQTTKQWGLPTDIPVSSMNTLTQ